MKNINIKQTVDCMIKQRRGKTATDDSNGVFPHCSDDLNFDPFDKDYGETGPLVGAHCDGKNYAWNAPESTDRHGLV